MSLLQQINTGGLLAKWRLDKKGEEYHWARGHTFNGHMCEVLHALGFFFNVDEEGRIGEGPADQRFRDKEGGVHPSFGHALYHTMQLNTFGVSVENFYLWSFLATLAHDLGKSSGEFQRMLWGLENTYKEARKKVGLPAKPSPVQNGTLEERVRQICGKATRHTQAYRHEFMSALLLVHEPQIADWFRTAAGSGYPYVIAGALGHHLKADLHKAVRLEKGGVRTSKGLLPYKPRHVFLGRLSRDLRTLLGSKRVPSPRLDPFPKLDDWEPDHPTLQSEESLKDAFETLDMDHNFYKTDDNPTSTAIKWMVILSDSVGSASQKKGKDGVWEGPQKTRSRVYQVYKSIFLPSDVDYYHRVSARLLGLTQEERTLLKGFSEQEIETFVEGELRPFQVACAAEKGNLIACASTGVGKSLGVFSWALPSLRLIFTTPTTDTSTRIYFDYADQNFDFLRHSRADFDLAFTSTPEDDPQDAAEDGAEDGELEHVFAQLSQDVTFTTADQVLGVMAFYRKSIMWLPYILSSQIVFDEFHAYDTTMWSWYLRFLDWFPGLRTAHMSATVPKYLMSQVEERVKRREPQKLPAAPSIIRDLRGQGLPSSIPRYKFHIIPTRETLAHFNPGTLWIVNTVARCQQIGMLFPDALCYHSRHRYINRAGREAQTGGPAWVPKGPKVVGIRDLVVQGFNQSPVQCRAVATQVAEMSLDLSQDMGVLITELCNPMSLIQRCGRLGRSPFVFGLTHVYIYLPLELMDNGLPYSTSQNHWKKDYARWMTFAEALASRDRGVSQADMDDLLQRFYRDPQNQSSERSIYTSLLKTQRKSLRHGSVTMQSILREDIQMFKRGLHPYLDSTPGRWPGVMETKLLAIPAILSTSQRRSLRTGVGMHNRHYIIENTPYDDRLGLLDHSRIPTFFPT